MFIPKVNEQKNLVANEILNPNDDMYGGATKFLAIDCEMDHARP